MLYSELPQPLYYLDPGSGSIIIQLVLAAILGLGVLVRSQWRRIKSLFKKQEHDDEDQDNG
jgi:hypothetical protein